MNLVILMGNNIINNRSGINSTITPNSIVCDSSSLISITDAGLFGALVIVSRNLQGNLIISEGVQRESIDRPINNPQYAFSAVRLKRALLDGIFQLAKPDPNTTQKILDLTNKMFYVGGMGGRALNLVHMGEAELLALAIDNDLSTIMIDERTTRMFIEDPMGMKNHMEKEFNSKITVNQKAFQEFQMMTRDIHAIRSTEVVALAYDMDYFSKFRELKEKAFESALYSLKFNGCAVSFDEIKELVREV